MTKTQSLLCAVVCTLLFAAPRATAQEEASGEPPFLPTEGFPGEHVKRFTSAGSVQVHQGASKYVSMVLKQWWPGQVLAVCFIGGEPELNRKIAEVALQWTKPWSHDGNQVRPNISLSFWEGERLRTCKEKDRSAIRVGFREKGYWSYVGRLSLDTSLVRPGEATLNLEGFDSPHSAPPESWFSSIVLHEFGHALGFEHEHQNPNSRCDEEFDWEAAYSYFKAPPNGWDRTTVDFNLRSIVGEGLLVGDHDGDSIMHYALPKKIFKKGGQSPCFKRRGLKISTADRMGILQAYPSDSTLPEMMQRRDALGFYMLDLKKKPSAERNREEPYLRMTLKAMDEHIEKLRP